MINTTEILHQIKWKYSTLSYGGNVNARKHKILRPKLVFIKSSYKTERNCRICRCLAKHKHTFTPNSRQQCKTVLNIVYIRSSSFLIPHLCYSLLVFFFSTYSITQSLDQNHPSSKCFTAPAYDSISFSLIPSQTLYVR